MLNKSGWIGLALFTSDMNVQAAAADDIHIIVKYKKSASTLVALQAQLNKTAGLHVQSMSPIAGGSYTVKFKSSEGLQGLNTVSDQTDLILQRLRKNPEIMYAVEDRKGYFKPLPTSESEPYKNLLSHDTQWDEFARPAGIMLESAPGLRDGAWAYTSGESKKPVVVAVLDTGVEQNESLVENLLKDKEGNIWGWNFAGNNQDISDETGSYHGTHVSGTIAGYGQVMQGMGEHLKILTVKIPDASGMFYESAVINGIYWAVGAEVPGVPQNLYPAKVLNMSFGVDEKPGKEIDHCDEALQDAVSYARKQGTVVIVAAGNDDRWEHYNAPAVCNGTVKVASSGPEGYRAYYSNYGPAITLAAPGGDLRYGNQGGILSTVNPGGGYQSSGFAFYQGTSMASPHVAGVAGLLYAVSDRALSAQTVEQILYTTTHDFGKSTDNNKSCVGKKPCGHGILDAENAVKTLINGFDVLLSAPALKSSDLKSCTGGLIKPSVARVDVSAASWSLVKSACAFENQLQHPRVEKNKAGEIYAYYGSSIYKLDQSTFKQCQVIGFDGVGCYR